MQSFFLLPTHWCRAQPSHTSEKDEKKTLNEHQPIKRMCTPPLCIVLTSFSLKCKLFLYIRNPHPRCFHRHYFSTSSLFHFNAGAFFVVVCFRHNFKWETVPGRFEQQRNKYIWKKIYRRVTRKLKRHSFSVFQLCPNARGALVNHFTYLDSTRPVCCDIFFFYFLQCTAPPSYPRLPTSHPRKNGKVGYS